MDNRERYTLHKNLTFKSSDIFENPDEFLKVDEIVVDVNFPIVPGLNEEIDIIFPSIKMNKGLSPYEAFYVTVEIDKDDGEGLQDEKYFKENPECLALIIYNMFDIVKSKKKNMTVNFQRVASVLSDKEIALEASKGIEFDWNIWKIGTTKDKLNKKLKKIRDMK